MSRRGRGGSRGGRGGRGGAQKIGGLEVTFDSQLDYDSPQPAPTYPVYNPTQPQPLNPREKRQVAHFLTIRKRIHEGPYYTVLGDNVRVGKKTAEAGSAAATFDPFEGMPTYTQKYIKKRRKLPNLSCRPYELKYFPTELHSTLDPTLTTPNADPNTNTNGNNTAPRPPNKKPNIIKASRANGAEAAEEKAAADDDDDAEPKERDHDDDDAMSAEDADDDFGDDDEGGDYDAEAYFNDGDDAGEELDGGGDGEGGGGGDYF